MSELSAAEQRQLREANETVTRLKQELPLHQKERVEAESTGAAPQTYSVPALRSHRTREAPLALATS